MKSIKITDSIVEKKFLNSVLFTFILVFILTVVIASCSNDKKDEPELLNGFSGQVNGKVSITPEKDSKATNMIAGSNCGECHSGIDSKEFKTEHSNPRKDNASKIPGTLLNKKNQ